MNSGISLWEVLIPHRFQAHVAMIYYRRHRINVLSLRQPPYSISVPGYQNQAIRR